MSLFQTLTSGKRSLRDIENTIYTADSEIKNIDDTRRRDLSIYNESQAPDAQTRYEYHKKTFDREEELDKIKRNIEQIQGGLIERKKTEYMNDIPIAYNTIKLYFYLFFSGLFIFYKLYITNFLDKNHSSTQLIDIIFYILSLLIVLILSFFVFKNLIFITRYAVFINIFGSAMIYYSLKGIAYSANDRLKISVYDLIPFSIQILFDITISNMTGLFSAYDTIGKTLKYN